MVEGARPGFFRAIKFFLSQCSLAALRRKPSQEFSNHRMNRNDHLTLAPHSESSEKAVIPGAFEDSHSTDGLRRHATDFTSLGACPGASLVPQ